MTREHIYFIPFIFVLGFLTGALATRARPLEVPAARSGRPVLVAGAVVLFVFIATHALAMHGGARHTTDLLSGEAIFDQQPSFTADEVYERTARFSPAGREAYQKMTYTSDLLFPLALFYFLVRLGRYVAISAIPRSAQTPKFLALVTLVPILWLLADLGENSIVYTLLGSFPARNDTLAGILGIVTDAKFTLLVASVVVPAVLLGVAKRQDQASPSVQVK
jgi:hypothetical protein